MLIDLWPIPLWNIFALGGFTGSPEVVINYKAYGDDSVVDQTAIQCVYQIQINR